MAAPLHAAVGSDLVVEIDVGTELEEKKTLLQTLRNRYVKFIISGKVLKMRALMFNGLDEYDAGPISRHVLNAHLNVKLIEAITAFTKKYTRATFIAANARNVNGAIPNYEKINSVMPAVIIYAGKNNCQGGCTPIINGGGIDLHALDAQLEAAKTYLEEVRRINADLVAADAEAEAAAAALRVPMNAMDALADVARVEAVEITANAEADTAHIGEHTGAINATFLRAMVTAVRNGFFHKMKDLDVRYLDQNDDVNMNHYTTIQWYLDTVLEKFNEGNQEDADEQNKVNYLSGLIDDVDGHENFNRVFFEKLKTNVSALLMVYSVLISSFNQNSNFVTNFLRIRQDPQFSDSHDDFNVYTRRKFNVATPYQTNVEVILSGHQPNAPLDVKYAMMYGPFNRVFVKQIPTTTIWAQVKQCIFNNHTPPELNNNHALIAYGASGTGKTSLFIQRNNPRTGAFAEAGLLSLIHQEFNRGVVFTVYETIGGVYVDKTADVRGIPDLHGGDFLSKLLYFMSENNRSDTRRRTHATVYNLVSSRSHIIIDALIGEKHLFISDFAGIEPRFTETDDFTVPYVYDTWKGLPNTERMSPEERLRNFTRFDQMRHLKNMISRMPDGNRMADIDEGSITAFVSANTATLFDNKMLMLIKQLTRTQNDRAKVDFDEGVMYGGVGAIEFNLQEMIEFYLTVEVSGLERTYGAVANVFMYWMRSLRSYGEYQRTPLWINYLAHFRSTSNKYGQFEWKKLVVRLKRDPDFHERYDTIPAFSDAFMNQDISMSVITQFNLNIFEVDTIVDYKRNCTALNTWWQGLSGRVGIDAARIDAYKQARSEEGQFIRSSLSALQQTIQQANKDAVPKFSEYCTDNICISNGQPSSKFEDCFLQNRGDDQADTFKAKIEEIIKGADRSIVVNSDLLHYCLFGIINVSPDAKQSGLYTNTFAAKILNKTAGVDTDEQSAPSLLGTLDYMQRFTTNMRTNITCTFAWNNEWKDTNMNVNTIIGNWYNMNGNALLNTQFPRRPPGGPPPPAGRLIGGPPAVGVPPPSPPAGPPPFGGPPPAFMGAPGAARAAVPPAPAYSPPAPAYSPPAPPAAPYSPPAPFAPPAPALAPALAPAPAPPARRLGIPPQQNIIAPRRKINDIILRRERDSLENLLKTQGIKAVKRTYENAEDVDKLAQIINYHNDNPSGNRVIKDNLRDMTTYIVQQQQRQRGGGIAYPFSVPDVGRWAVLVTVCAGVGTLMSRRVRRIRPDDLTATIVAFAMGYALALFFVSVIATLDPEVAPCFAPMRVAMHAATMVVGVAAALAYARAHPRADANRVMFALFAWAMVATVAI